MTTTPQFTIAPYSLADIGANGGGTIAVRMDGYWSENAATLYVNRNIKWDDRERGIWACEIIHSSGGRDKNVVPDNLEAETNFAMGLLQLVHVGRALLLQSELLEALYQAQSAKNKALKIEEDRLAQERAESDPALGKAGALALIEKACDAAMRSRHGGVTIRAFRRGEQRPGRSESFTFTPTRSKRTTIRHLGIALAKSAAVEVLSALSHRSALQEGMQS